MASDFPSDYKHPNPGVIYISEEEEKLLEKIEVLKDFNLFIIQRKTEMDCLFGTNVTHEILDQRRNVILKATRSPTSFFGKKKKSKVVVRNRLNTKLFGIVIESTNNQVEGSEATVFIHPNKKVAHIEKYGGVNGPCSFEIFNADGKTAFTSDPKAKQVQNANLIEYVVSAKTCAAATVMMKTGLNFVLSTQIDSMRILDKATLLAAVLAMDVLQTGTRLRTDSIKPRTNQYS